MAFRCTNCNLVLTAGTQWDHCPKCNSTALENTNNPFPIKPAQPAPPPAYKIPTPVGGPQPPMDAPLPPGTV